MSRAASGREAVIVSTARTALTKSWKGAFNMTHGATLGGHVIKAAVERAKVDPASIEDVIMGCAYPEGATGFNIARQAALRAGLPVTVAGVTVNRFCSSGLQSIALAAQRIIAGEGDVYVAGGLESISCVQGNANEHMAAESWLTRNKPAIYHTMLQTAETVAARYSISRERQDEYGARSQQRACAGQAAGHFTAEIAPITVRMAGVDQAAGGRLFTREVTVAQDEGLRDGTTVEAIARIRAATPGGTVAAGPASISSLYSSKRPPKAVNSRTNFSLNPPTVTLNPPHRGPRLGPAAMRRSYNPPVTEMPWPS